MDRLDSADRTRPDTVDLAEAARRLGISVDAVRKRLKRGQLQGFKAEGGRWYVQWDPVLDPPESGAGSTRPDQITDGLVEELRREVQRLEADIAWHKRMMSELVARVPQLPERTETGPESIEVTSDPRAERGRPRRWWEVWKQRV